MDLLWRHISLSPLLRHTAFSSWSVFSGLAFAYSIPPKLFPGIEWVGFVPFLSLLLFPIKNRWVLFFYGWLSFSVATGVYTSWMLDAHPLTWLGITDFWVSFPLTLLAWFAVFSIPGLAGGILLVVAKTLLQNNFLDVIRLGLLIAATDYLRTFLAAWHPFLLGNGSIYGDNWATNILGYAIADYDHLRQLASIGGLYALSFITALPNALLFYWIRSLRNPRAPRLLRRGIAAGIGVGALLGVLALGGRSLRQVFYAPVSSLRVAIVSAAFTPEDWAQPKLYLRDAAVLFRELIRTAAAAEPTVDIILLPEGSVLSTSTPALVSSFQTEVKALLSEGPFRVLINLLPTGDASYRAVHPLTNDIRLFTATGEVFATYSKRFLMPFGEYMPWAFDWAGRRLGYGPWLDRSAPPRLAPGSENGVFPTPAGTLGVLGCSELISPYVSRKVVQDGAEVLLYTASVGILRGSERLHQQNLAIAQIRASETRRFLAYAANGGRSFFVAPDGTLLWENPVIAPGVNVVEARSNSALTPAVRYGNWFPLVSLGLLLVDRVAQGFRGRGVANRSSTTPSGTAVPREPN